MQIFLIFRGGRFPVCRNFARAVLYMASWGPWIFATKEFSVRFKNLASISRETNLDFQDVEPLNQPHSRKLILRDPHTKAYHPMNNTRCSFNESTNKCTILLVAGTSPRFSSDKSALGTTKMCSNWRVNSSWGGIWENIDTLKFTTRLESSWPVKWVGGLRSLGTYMQDEDECPVGGDPGTITMVPSQCSTWCFGWVDPAKSERLSWLANFNHLLTLHLMTTLFNDYEPGVPLTGIDPWIFLQTVQWVDNFYFVIYLVWVLDWKYLCQNRCQRDYQNPDAVRRSYSIKQIVCSCKIHIQIWRLY